MLELTDADRGSTREVQVGDSITVRLPENATTGYRWAPRVDESRLREVPVESPPAPTMPRGAGHERVFVFDVVAPGPTDLTLENKRSWEATAIDEYSVHLEVS